MSNQVDNYNPESQLRCSACGQTTVEIEDLALPDNAESSNWLLECNEVPTDTHEHDFFHRRCQQTAEAIALVGSHIDRLLESVNTLQGKKKELEQRLKRYKGVISPVRRLPHDVLACIFGFSVELDNPRPKSLAGTGFDKPTNLDTHGAPWVLGQVCRSWRASITSLPLLWTTFIIASTYLGDRRSFLTDLISLKIKRSQNHLLHVVFGELKNDLAVHLFSELCTRASLWQDAEFVIDTRAASALEPFSGLFQNLRELHLYVDSGGPQDTSAFLVFQNTPNLRTVSIRGQNAFTESLVLPWRQLSRFTAIGSHSYFVDNSFHFQVLPRIENVEVCWLDCVYDDPPPPELGHLKLTFLHTLVLSSTVDRGNSGISQVLDHISLPALRDLEFRNGIHDSASLIRFLENSGCSLRRLHVSAVAELDVVDILGLLHSKSSSLHSVDTLELCFDANHVGTHLVGRVLRRMTIVSGAGHPLPSLRCFQTNMRQPLQELVDMVQSRCPVGSDETIDVAPLRRLILWGFTSTPSTDDQVLLAADRAVLGEKLREACSEGLSLEWKSLPVDPQRRSL